MVRFALVALCACALIAACKQPVQPAEPAAIKSAGTISVTGTVRHFTFEGGFWAVRGDDSTTYDPLGTLPAAVQQEGLRVRITGILRPDVGSFHMAGPIVELTSIRPL